MINRGWHETHILGQHASLDDRVRWHTEHIQVCDCHDMPDSIKNEIARRAAEPDATRDSGR